MDGWMDGAGRSLNTQHVGCARPRACVRACGCVSLFLCPVGAFFPSFVSFHFFRAEKGRNEINARVVAERAGCGVPAVYACIWGVPFNIFRPLSQHARGGMYILRIEGRGSQVNTRRCVRPSTFFFFSLEGVPVVFFFSSELQKLLVSNRC
ncbi:unnamed protein product [Pylaiella littoralis]